MKNRINKNPGKVEILCYIGVGSFGSTIASFLSIFGPGYVCLSVCVLVALCLSVYGKFHPGAFDSSEPD